MHLYGHMFVGVFEKESRPNQTQHQICIVKEHKYFYALSNILKFGLDMMLQKDLEAELQENLSKEDLKNYRKVKHPHCGTEVKTI